MTIKKGSYPTRFLTETDRLYNSFKNFITMRSRISPLQLESKLAVTLDLINYYKRLKSSAETENIGMQANFYMTILTRLLSRYCELAMQLTFFNMEEITTSGALYLLGVPYSEVDGRFYIHP